MRVFQGLFTAVAAVWLAATSTQAAPAKPPQPAFTHNLDAVVTAYSDANVFSGVVLVAKDGKPIFSKSYGLANREWGVPNTVDTRFRLGSITKQFTAAAILQLAEHGKLSLDDPISKYYAAPVDWAPVTLRNLLTHTSGIPSYTAIPGFFGSPSRTDRTPEEIVALTRDKPLAFKPGEKFAYDNTGYILLGYVIEKVSGQTYQAYIQDHILGPLGLKSTGYDVTETILPRRAAGYSRAGGVMHNAPFLAMSLPYAAGSLYSTADDLLAWDQALHAGKILSPASVTAMFTDHGFKYGYGQFITTTQGHRLWAHAGGINGFSTDLARLPDDGVTLVLLSNIQEAPIGAIFERAVGLYFEPLASDEPSGRPGAAELDRYVGRYQLATVPLTVTREGDRLFAQTAGQAKVELFRELGHTFFARFPAYRFEFGAGAKAPQVIVHQGATDLTAKRID